jgi:twitching motility protein PilT
VEEPVEYQFPKMSHSVVTQREVGLDVLSFADGLKSGLRQDPDVILVGEMRDTETIEIALKAAETGHLVLSTVHTTDCIRTIGRIVGTFDPAAQTGVRNRLADNLRATVSQRLLPHASGKGRVVACEVMVSTLSVVEYVKDPDQTPKIKDYLEEQSDVLGTQSFDQHLAQLVAAGQITQAVALEAATSRSDLERAFNFG